MTNNERSVPGFAGIYATHDGHIVSYKSGARRLLKERIRKGYPIVTLKISVGKRDWRSVHRLVASAWHGLPVGNDQECRHLDGSRDNNIPANLAWGTSKDNAADAIRHGTLGKGMLSRRRKLHEAQVTDIIDRSLMGEHYVALAAEYRIHPTYIKQLVDGKHWSHLPRHNHQGVGA
jgi:hypothetical protein